VKLGFLSSPQPTGYLLARDGGRGWLISSRLGMGIGALPVTHWKLNGMERWDALEHTFLVEYHLTSAFQ